MAANENALALQAKVVTPSVYDMIRALAASAASAGIDNRYALEVKMVVCWELGIPLATGWKTVYIIEGTPIVAPKLIHGLVLRHPQFAGYEEEMLTGDDGRFLGWRITLKRRWNQIDAPVTVTRQFTLDDARNVKRKGKHLIDGDNWQNYPRNMAYWRAIAHVEDALFPDATFGFHRADWYGAPVTADGEIIEGEWIVPPDIQLEMRALYDEYGADAMRQVMGSAPDPTTIEEVQTIKEALKAL